jgi:Domain of unknown function (DUF3303)
MFRFESTILGAVAMSELRFARVSSSWMRIDWQRVVAKTQAIPSRRSLAYCLAANLLRRTHRMLYMVIERFKDGAAPEVYRRAREQGRMLPPGLEYIDSWVDIEFSRCFQLMRTVDRTLFDAWIAAWRDLVAFEVVPIRSSADAAQIITAGS